MGWLFTGEMKRRMQVYRMGIIKVSSRWAKGSINLLIPTLSLRAQSLFHTCRNHSKTCSFTNAVKSFDLFKCFPNVILKVEFISEQKSGEFGP